MRAYEKHDPRLLPPRPFVDQCLDSAGKTRKKSHDPFAQERMMAASPHGHSHTHPHKLAKSQAKKHINIVMVKATPCNMLVIQYATRADSARREQHFRAIPFPVLLICCPKRVRSVASATVQEQSQDGIFTYVSFETDSSGLECNRHISIKK